MRPPSELRCRFASRWRSIAPIPSAPPATRAWTRSASGWRTSTPSDAGAKRTAAFPVDASGTLPDGKTFNGPDQLKEILVANRDAFTQGMAEKMMIYALGRGLEPADRPAIRAIAQQVGTKRLPDFSDGARHRQQRAVSTKKRRPQFAMIVTRKHLPRRTFLRGIGASLALPILDSMTPAFAAPGGKSARCDCSSPTFPWAPT